MRPNSILLGMGFAALAAGAVATVVWSPRGFALPGPASASASLSASAGPVRAPARERVDLASIDIPETKSPMPKDAEWKDAKLVRVTRNVSSRRDCDVEILREYVRVSCTGDVPGIRQFAGDIDDIETWVTPKKREEYAGNPPSGGHVIFPLRKGHGHVFEFFELVAEYEGSSVGPRFVVDAYWPESDKHPTIVIRGRLL